MNKREIKFRFWDDGEMCEDASYRDEFLINANIEAYQKMSGNYVVMQYTGLKDKNGKEIYEGDIVVLQYVGGDSSIEEIRWDTGSFVSHINGHPEDRIMDKDFKKCEVIGNIYENPELIK